MAKKYYAGIAGVARNGTQLTSGIAGVARAGLKGYAGVDGVARIFFESGVPWSKYNFTIGTEQVPYIYYTEKNSVISGGSANTVSGYTGYSFDSSTGTFTLTGSYVTLTSGVDNGTVFTGGGSSVTAKTPTMGGGYAASRITAVRNTGYTNETTYTVGSLVGTVYAEEGTYPDAEEGFSYFMDYAADGVTYTIMTNGNAYYAYTPQ